MTTVLFSVSAALATLVVVLLVLLLRRPRNRTRAVLADVSGHAGDGGMELLVRDLSEALERAKEEGRRNRFVADLAGSIDLDEVLARTLLAATELPGFNAAMIVLDQTDGPPLIATQSMDTDEAKQYAPPSGGHARTVSVRYSYAPSERRASLIRGGSFAPLTAQEGEAIGCLAVYWRSDRDQIGRAHV